MLCQPGPADIQVTDNHSDQLFQSGDHLRDAGALLGPLVPTLPYQVLDLEAHVLGQFGAEIVLGEFGGDLAEGQLAVLPIAGDDFIEDDSEGVDVCLLGWFDDDVVALPQLFHGRVDVLVGVARDQGEVLLHAVQPVAVDQHLAPLEEDVVGREAPVHQLRLVEVLHRLGHLERDREQLPVGVGDCGALVEGGGVVALDQVDDAVFGEVAELGLGADGQLAPEGELVLDVLEYIAGYLVLGDADDVVAPLEAASLAQPDRVLLLELEVLDVAEGGERGVAVLALLVLGAYFLEHRLLEVLNMIREDTFGEGLGGGLVVEGLHHRPAQTVHDRQALPAQHQQDRQHEHPSQYDVDVDLGAVGPVVEELLEAVLDVDGDQHFEGDHEGAADEDDDLRLVEAADGLVETGLKHDAGHLEVEVEEGHHEADDHGAVEPDRDVVDRLETYLVDVVDDQRDDEHQQHHQLHALENPAQHLRLFLGGQGGTFEAGSVKIEKQRAKQVQSATRNRMMMEKSARVMAVLAMTSTKLASMFFHSSGMPMMMRNTRMAQSTSLEAMQKTTPRQYLRLCSSKSFLARRTTTRVSEMRQMLMMTTSTNRISTVAESRLPSTRSPSPPAMPVQYYQISHLKTDAVSHCASEYWLIQLILVLKLAWLRQEEQAVNKEFKQGYLSIKISQRMTDEQAPRYQSFWRVLLICQIQGIAAVHQIYVLIFLSAIPFQTMVPYYGITIDKSLAQGALNAIVRVLAVFGSIFSYQLFSRVSRRQYLLIVNGLAIISIVMLMIPNSYTLILSRLIQGATLGLQTAKINTIIKQLSPRELSGPMGSLFQVNSSLGGVYVFLLVYVLRKVTGDATGEQFWFIIYGSGVLPTVLQLVGIALVFPYETPKYCLMQGDQEGARQIITEIYKPEFMEEVLAEQKQSLQQEQRTDLMLEQEEQGSMTVSTPVMAMFVGLYLSFFLHFNGTNTVMLYAESFLSKSISGQLALLIPTLVMTLKFLASLTSPFFLSCAGRRIIMIIGYLSFIVANSVIGVGFWMNQEETFTRILLSFGLFVEVMIFAATTGAVTWLYIPEIVATPQVSVVLSVTWLSAAVAALIFPVIRDHVFNGNPGGIFMGFAVISLVTVIVCAKYMVETVDKRAVQIRKQYEAKKVC